MKKLILLVVLTAAIAAGQNCTIGLGTMTAAGSTGNFDNRTQGCVNWTFSYMSTGFSAVSLVIQSANDNGGVPGSWSTYSGTVNAGANPNTAITQATTLLTGYFPWIRVTLSSVTGTGTIRGTLYGCAGTQCVPTHNGSGGSGTVINLTTLTDGFVVLGAGGVNVKISNVGIDTFGAISTPSTISTGVGGSTDGEIDFIGHTSGLSSNLVADADQPAATINMPRVSGRMATRTGSFANTDCVNYLNGNFISFGGPCGGGGGGGSPGGSFSEKQYRAGSSTFGAVVNTAPMPTGWTRINGAVLSDFSGDRTALFIPPSTSLAFRFAVQTLPSPPYTAIVELHCAEYNQSSLSGFVDAQACGLYISDGTKFESMEVIQNNGTNFAPQVHIRQSSGVTSGGSAVAGPTSNLVPPTDAVFAVRDDGVNRTWEYWTNGAFVVFFSEPSGTFLTPNVAGFGGINFSNLPTDLSWLSMNLNYFCVANATTCRGK